MQNRASVQPADRAGRVFFCTAARKIILLVSGYDKARDPSDRRQQREIARARRLLTAYREAQKQAGKRR